MKRSHHSHKHSAPARSSHMPSHGTAAAIAERPFPLLLRAVLRGVGVAMALLLIGSLIATLIAFTSSDPAAISLPLSLCVLALCAVGGGVICGRTYRHAPLLCGALLGGVLLLLFFLSGALFPDALIGAHSQGLAMGLRAGVVVFCILGSTLGQTAPKRRRKRRGR